MFLFYCRNCFVKKKQLMKNEKIAFIIIIIIIMDSNPVP